MAYKITSKILYDKGIKKDNGKTIPPSTIEKLLQNKFYIGFVKHNGEYYKGIYDTFISKRLFENAQNVGRGIHYRKSTPHLYPLKGFIRSDNGFFTKLKGHTYYMRSSDGYSVNVNQEIIFKHFGTLLSNLNIDDDFKNLNKEIILDLLENLKPKDIETINQIDFKIRKYLHRKRNY